ncbi:MAG: hypothetical protein GY816_03570 [Cytophagales bacterium]|nr:hypothetical protein [Cytophagales bacterium]
MYRTISFYLLVLLFSCDNKSEVEVITLTKQDLIPEGIAVHEFKDIIYLSNLKSKNVVQFLEDGSGFEEINTPYTGKMMGLGIEQIDGKIYSIGNSLNDSIYYSVLQIMDAETKDLIEKYELKSKSPSFINDLVVRSNGEIYITNSDNNSLHRIDKLAKELVVVPTSGELIYPNGITMSNDETRLFIASANGVRIYDPNTKIFLNDPDSTRMSRGIDGLKYYKNSLIGVQNGSADRKNDAIIRFYLDKEEKSIIGADTLVINHPNFDIPTTLDIKDGWVYCLANSQMDNLDQDGNLVRVKELTDTYIIKFKLD